MGPTGPDPTKSADFVGDPGLVGSGSGPVGFGRARVVEFSYKSMHYTTLFHHRRGLYGSLIQHKRINLANRN